MSLLFKVGAEGVGGGRRGELVLPHGVVQTPVFMPVGTAATVKAVEQGVLESDWDCCAFPGSEECGPGGFGGGDWGGDYSGEYLSPLFEAGA